MVTIAVRGQTVPDSATVVLQLGAGDERSRSQMVDKMRREHDFWCGVLDIRGRFAISVYVLDGLDEADLLAIAPHSFFGRSSVREIEETFELVPTTISMPRKFPTDRFQPWHFSVLLPEPGVERAKRFRTQFGRRNAGSSPIS